MTSAFRGYNVREFQETPNPAALTSLITTCAAALPRNTDAMVSARILELIVLGWGWDGKGRDVETLAKC